MRYSVVITNYNGAAYLEAALESVQAQDNSDFEIILVDDGSTDDSANLIHEWEDRFPLQLKPLFLPDNQGQAAGFNAALRIAAGEYIAFLDSDDCWMPNKLSNMTELIALSPGAALYQHNLFLLQQDIPTQQPYRTTLESGQVYDKCIRTRRLPLFVPTSGLVFPRTVLEHIMPMPVEFRTCADGYLTRTAICYGNVVSCCEAWGYYRVHTKNNVYANSDHNNRKYRHHLLAPALNQYYVSMGSPLCFPAYRRKWRSADGEKNVSQRSFSTLAPSWFALIQAWFIALLHLPLANLLNFLGRFPK